MAVTSESEGGITFGTEDGNVEVMCLNQNFRVKRDLHTRFIPS